MQGRKTRRRVEAGSGAKGSPHSEAKRVATSRAAAFARPRVLLALMTLLLAGGSWWAMAQRASTPGTSPKPQPAKVMNGRKPLGWKDLPRLVSQYGQRREREALTGKLRASGSSGGFGRQRFPLTESDLTPNNRSDEREPVFRAPTGDVIAFASNGIDADRNGQFDATGLSAGGRYHIWIINRNGQGLRQVTGFGADAGRDQRSPTWSPEGGRLCYTDGPFPGGAVQLSIIQNVVQSTTPPIPTPITFFQGIKADPAWSPGGNDIAFASNFAPTGTGNSAISLGNFDIFTISATGLITTVRRLTGDPDNRQSTTPSRDDPQDVVGNTTDDRAPEYSLVNTGVLFFSSNRETVSTTDPATNTTTVSQTRLATGRRIWAMSSGSGDGKRQVTNPVARGGSADDMDDNPSASRTGTLPSGAGRVNFGERVAFQTNSRIDANDTVADLNVWSLSVATNNDLLFLNDLGGTRPAFEGSIQGGGNVAQVESNVLSTRLSATGPFLGAMEDRSADREPAFSRAETTTTISNQFGILAFASQRRFLPRPGSNGQNPRPIVINPGGGEGASATHDIFVTASQDFTPPLLLPVSTGNQTFPFLAPGEQAPFDAPRTREEGLSPNGKLIVGVVIQDLESGLNVGGPQPTPTVTPLPDPNATPTVAPTISATNAPLPIVPPDIPDFEGNSVSVRIRNGNPNLNNFNNFDGFLTRPNEGVAIVNAVERDPDYISGDIPLTVVDNGPGRTTDSVLFERQAEAIRGDGIYYAQASLDLATVLAGQPIGDYIIDLIVTDRSGNSLTYDKVYGFSTETFTRRTNLLFVSDYTLGQTFPAVLLGPDAGGRTKPDVAGFDFNLPGFQNNEGGLVPVESYHLANPGGAAVDRPRVSENGSADLTTFSPPGTSSFGQVPTSVDVWRVLSRGPVTQGVFQNYQPQARTQIDPNAPGLELTSTVVTATPTPGAVPTATPVGTAEPLPTVPVTVAERAIIWASPYTAQVFASAGTIADTNTQRQLSDFLNQGGRLFLNGQDILFALTGAGTEDNNFVRDELKTSFITTGRGGETGANDELVPGFGYTLNGNPQSRIANRTPRLPLFPPFVRDPPLEIQVPFNDANPLDNTYWDAADNDRFLDILGPPSGGPDAAIGEVYNYGGGPRAGQTIERSNRAGGLQSTVVFFGFGLEHINRRWTTTTNPPLAPCRNYRGKIAENIANFLRTGRITGRVLNAATNLPIPNFLMQVTDPGFNQRFFLVRTDANGFYEFAGVPSRDDFYRVSPASQTLSNGRIRPLNPGYVINQNIVTQVTVIGGEVTNDINFRVNPQLPSTVVGRAISDRGTPTNVDDDVNPQIEVAPNVPVLLRSLESISPSANFPAGGVYAQLVQTDAFGQFAFTNVPNGLRAEIIFNPLPGFISQGGDIPDGSGINYDTPTARIRRNPNFGRRAIANDPTYTGPRVQGVPATGDFFVLDDIVNLGDVPIPPAGSDVSGRVFRAGLAAPGAIVQIFSGGTVVRSVTTDAQGRYTLGDLQPGTYTIVATLTVGSATLTGRTTVTIQRGISASAPDIVLGTTTTQPTPGGTPSRTPGVNPTGTPRATATPVPTTNPANETYQPGQTYMISIPFADSTAPNAVTSVARAFTLPPQSGTVVNYRLTRYDAIRGAYVQLSASSAVRRGEGYFLTPLARAVSLRMPPADRTRVPTGVTEFTITLRRNPSQPITGNNNFNGFNLIGFPFNPAVFRSINWSESQVIAPDGRRFASIRAAAGAGLLSDRPPFTLRDGTRDYVQTDVLVPFRGYFVRTFVDNVRVVLRARR